MALFTTAPKTGYTQVNASFMVTSADARLMLGLVGRNLTDEAAGGFIITTPVFNSYFASPNPPREIGLTGAYRF